LRADAVRGIPSRGGPSRTGTRVAAADGGSAARDRETGANRQARRVHHPRPSRTAAGTLTPAYVVSGLSRTARSRPEGGHYVPSGVERPPLPLTCPAREDSAAEWRSNHEPPVVSCRTGLRVVACR